jgi:hypothetical protein
MTVMAPREMLARSRPTEILTRRRRTRDSSPSAARPPRQPTPPAATGATTAEASSGPAQDSAVYNCHCGMVFEAAVSTTIACPHCGDSQGW